LHLSTKPEMDILDLSSLEQALNSLELAVNRSRREPHDDMVRDSVIQRFEYSYELSWKMLKRQLEKDAASPTTIDTLSFKELIREGAERGYISQPEAWFEYRYQRNITSHTYNEKKAIAVYQAAVNFLNDAKQLFTILKTRNQNA